MKRLPARILIVALTLCIAFTSFPFFTGDLVSDAATTKITLKTSLNSSNKPYLTWNKVSSPYNGYSVWKNGKLLKRLNTKTVSYTDTSVGVGQTNTYQIKTYKTTKKTKKITQWYNKKTKKWQNTKPAKKYCGKSRKVKKLTYSYSYKNPSNAQKITTKKPQKISVSVGNEVILAKGCKTPLSITTDTGNYTFQLSSDCVMIRNNAIYGLKTGSCTVTVSAPANTYYNSASKSFKVTVRDPNCVHAWSAWEVTKAATYTSSGTKQRKCTKCGLKETATIPKLEKVDPATRPLSYWIGKSDDDFEIGAEIPTTDYKGRKHILKKVATNSWYDSSYGGYFAITNQNAMASVSKDVDGEWTSGGHKFMNYHGATFDLDVIANPIYYGMIGVDCYFFEAYNCDESKINVTCDADIVQYETYRYDRDTNRNIPITQYYYAKNNKFLAMPIMDSGRICSVKEKIGTRTKFSIAAVTNAALSGYAIGIDTGYITFTIQYDGKKIGTMTIDTTTHALHQDWTVETCRYQSPIRKLAYDIAIKATGGKKVDYDTDMKKIIAYIHDNYTYKQPIYYNDNDRNFAFDMSCIGGAIVLETYSIIEYGEYGFDTSKGGSVYHHAFSPNSNPSAVYAAQGH